MTEKGETEKLPNYVLIPAAFSTIMAFIVGAVMLYVAFRKYFLHSIALNVVVIVMVGLIITIFIIVIYIKEDKDPNNNRSDK